VEWDLAGALAILLFLVNLIDDCRLVALMLGHFRMNINQAIDSLLDVAFAVFPEGSQQALTSETNSSKLKAAIEDILQARQIPLDTKMNEPSRQPTGCKVYVIFLWPVLVPYPPQCSLCGDFSQYEPSSRLPYISVSRI
jgi:hypothetical protein